MKKHKGLKVAAIIIAAIAVFIAVINLLPPEKVVASNPFIVGKNELPMIAAHRGGGDNNPENTMLAYREAVNTANVDIIECDLYMTADGVLVCNHDAYIDRTCNVNGDISRAEAAAICDDAQRRHYIEDMTLEELRSYNFGYYFEDSEGTRIYKDVADHASAGLQIVTVDELFGEFYESNPDLMFIVEIKNGGETGMQACNLLNKTLDKYPEYRDQIVVGTFNDEIEQALVEFYPDIMRGASMSSAKGFILTQLLGVNILDKSDFSCLQIPMSYDLGFELKLDLATIINRAQRRNIAVQYWTINEAEDMRRLIDLGCDCIMTDDPLLMRQVLDEYAE